MVCLTAANILWSSEACNWLTTAAVTTRTFCLELKLKTTYLMEMEGRCFNTHDGYQMKYSVYHITLRLLVAESNDWRQQRNKWKDSEESCWSLCGGECSSISESKRSRLRLRAIECTRKTASVAASWQHISFFKRRQHRIEAFCLHNCPLINPHLSLLL